MYFEDLQNTVTKYLKGQDFDPPLRFEADFTPSRNTHFDPLTVASSFFTIIDASFFVFQNTNPHFRVNH